MIGPKLRRRLCGFARTTRTVTADGGREVESGKYVSGIRAGLIGPAGTELHVNLTVQAVGAFAQDPRLAMEVAGRLARLLSGSPLGIACGSMGDAPERKFFRELHRRV
jgi:hypothetical protein